MLQKATQNSDARVAANAVEVLSHFEDDSDTSLDDLMRHKDRRIAANALVSAGKKEVSVEVVQLLSQMLQSPDHSRVASGVYSLGEISAYHFKRDPVYYRTQVDLLELVDTLLSLARHESESVSRQANKAISKIDDPELLERLGCAAVSKAS